jgi:lipopolysaccharide/colanic/teichoic acid biosynthesis glycosyltransferase
VIKPIIDRVGAALMLILAVPFMLVIAVAVAVGSGRPIISRQVRVGQYGTRFTLYKFHTMTGDRRYQDLPPGTTGA